MCIVNRTKKKNLLSHDNFSIIQKEGCFTEIKFTKALSDEVQCGFLIKHYMESGNIAVGNISSVH